MKKEQKKRNGMKWKKQIVIIIIQKIPYISRDFFWLLLLLFYVNRHFVHRSRRGRRRRNHCATENLKSHSNVTRTPLRHSLSQDRVFVIIRWAISFPVISTVAISCRLLRLRIAFYTKFIFHSANGCDLSNYFIDFCRHSFSVLLVRALTLLTQRSDWMPTTLNIQTDAKQLQQQFPLNRHFFT